MSKSDVNVEGTTSVSCFSRDEKSPSSSFNQESSALPLDAQSDYSSVVDYKTCLSSTNIEGSFKVRTIMETLDEMPPSDPDPSCSIPSEV